MWIIHELGLPNCLIYRLDRSKNTIIFTMVGVTLKVFKNTMSSTLINVPVLSFKHLYITIHLKQESSIYTYILPNMIFFFYIIVYLMTIYNLYSKYYKQMSGIIWGGELITMSRRFTFEKPDIIWFMIILSRKSTVSILTNFLLK